MGSATVPHDISEGLLRSFSATWTSEGGTPALLEFATRKPHFVGRMLTELKLAFDFEQLFEVVGEVDLNAMDQHQFRASVHFEENHRLGLVKFGKYGDRFLNANLLPQFERVNPVRLKMWRLKQAAANEERLATWLMSPTVCFGHIWQVLDRQVRSQQAPLLSRNHPNIFKVARRPNDSLAREVSVTWTPGGWSLDLVRAPFEPYTYEPDTQFFVNA